MPRWTTLTLQQLRTASKADIVKNVGQYIFNHFTTLQICKWLLDVELITDRVEVTKDDAGRIVNRVRVWRHILTGEIDHNTETTYSYYDNGDIKDIIITQRDDVGEIASCYTIHHYQDGRQPMRIDG